MMLRKQIPFFLALLLSLSSLSKAWAQEDEPYYKSYKQKHGSQLPTKNQPRSAARSTLGSTLSPCDVGVNGDFESQISPPTHLNNMGGEFGGTFQPDQLSNWYSPAAGTPDYWADNAGTPSGPNGSDMHPGKAVYGPFSPHSPIGAVGLFSRAAYSSYDESAEYASASIPALITNARYYAEFWVSLSQNRSFVNCGYKQGFGFVLGPTNASHNTRTVLTVPSGATSFLSSIGQTAVNYGPSGNANWQRLSTQFTGQGETLITFGLFNPTGSAFSASASNYYPLPGGASNIPNAYVFLDDVHLYKIPTAGSGASICPGKTALLGEGCSIPNATYNWTAPPNAGGTIITSPTAMQVTVKPTITSTYKLTVTLPDGSTYDSYATITVLPTNPPVPTLSVIDRSECAKTVTYQITNYSASNNYSFPPGNINGLTVSSITVQNGVATFVVTATSGSTSGVFTLQAVGPCGGSSGVTASTSFPTTISSPDVLEQYQDDCQQTGHFLISNFDKGATYTITRVSGYGNPIPVHPTINQFKFKAGGGATYGIFNVTVTCGSQSQTSQYEIDYQCSGGVQPAFVQTAFPNPATESLTLPTGAVKATLLNGQGQPVQRADGAGQLDVRQLPAGLYNLQFYQDGKLVNQRIEVKH